MPSHIIDDGSPLQGSATAAPTLTELLAMLDDVARGFDEGHSSPLHAAVGISHGPSPTIQLCLPSRAGCSVVDELVGTLAPPSWSAVGIIATGAAWRYDVAGSTIDTHGGVGGPRARDWVGVVHLSDRTGAHATRIRGIDPGDDGQEVDLGPPASGRLLDVCQRMLELPTAPPTHDIRSLWESVWLDRILMSAYDPDPGSIGWPELAGLHPAAVWSGPTPPDGRLRAKTGDPSRSWTPAELGQRGSELADAFGWDQLREAASHGRWSSDALSASDAAWMDAGVFSRWLSDHHPAPAAVSDLADLLGEEMIDMIEHGLGDPRRETAPGGLPGCAGQGWRKSSRSCCRSMGSPKRYP